MLEPSYVTDVNRRTPRLARAGRCLCPRQIESGLRPRDARVAGSSSLCPASCFVSASLPAQHTLPATLCWWCIVRARRRRPPYVIRHFYYAPHGVPRLLGVDAYTSVDRPQCGLYVGSRECMGVFLSLEST
jgi:hypothetical protein